MKKNLILLFFMFLSVIIAAQKCEQPIKKSQKATKMTKTKQQLNVLGEPLQPCCFNPMTGYFRTGSCETSEDDYGVHVVCATVTQEFLDFSKARGNDLMASSPWFPGLKAGDNWCLCALRWREALEAGVAPPINLASTHINALKYVTLEDLKSKSKEQW